MGQLLIVEALVMEYSLFRCRWGNQPGTQFPAGWIAGSCLFDPINKIEKITQT